MEKSFSTVEDIIADEGFQAWYLAGNETARQVLGNTHRCQIPP